MYSPASVRTAATRGADGVIDGVAAVDDPEAAPEATPPPSLDGKGTLINTYA